MKLETAQQHNAQLTGQIDFGDYASGQAALVHAAQEALLALAVFKFTDSDKPYHEISNTFRKQLLKAHDLLLFALLANMGVKSTHD